MREAVREGHGVDEGLQRGAGRAPRVGHIDLAGAALVGAESILALTPIAIKKTRLHPIDAIWSRVLSSAAYYGAFVGALGLMHCLVRRLQQFDALHRLLLAGPSAGLYPSYLLSSFAISSILSFGMLNLVCGSLDRHLQRHGHAEEARREGSRGVMVAALRGFALVPLLAPTSVAVAILTRELPGLSWAHLLPFGLLAATVLLLIGWRLDNHRLQRLREAGAAQPSAASTGQPGMRRLVLASLLGILAIEGGALTLLGVLTGFVLGTIAAVLQFGTPAGVAWVGGAFLLGQAIEGIAYIMAVYLTISLSISLFMNWYNARIALVER